ncbi:kynurenine/alpha-aminoadipate aminotransferase, mitochondrial-like isoform X3 [Haliotis rufescens]|uniref:kynurenine/alpha-aminoadipate aminotransferase, mitochondrial-like isoform X3 n=1 Tax=Haliotis rufescens TaxID=6454 RepID=UPI00201F56B2|nr:kynurenine/alpha-aminoadipate aminotransferase, mitochondrial-like isoform X3 [Haliotis rufescens]
MGEDAAPGANHRINNYEKYFNKSARRRKPTILRGFQKYLGTDMLYMAGGHPNTETFPITTAQLRLRDGRTLDIDEDEMKVALQYGDSRGSLKMREWLTELQRRFHDPPTLPPLGVSPSANSDMITILTNGCTEALSKVIGLVLEEGDSLLVEESTYPSVLNVIEPLGCKPVTVKNDADGLIPSDLSNILISWNEAVSGPRPKLLYCVPVGGNPTGANLTLKRKKEVYALARKYDLLIIEDDPYYMLQFTRPLIPSLLSLDVDGRVLRCDSFSKMLAAGARIGYLSGPKQFLEKFIEWKDVNAFPNSLAETIVWKVLQNMGHDGFIEHGCRVANFYHKRSQHASRIAEAYLKGLAEWSDPVAGMFLWMKLLGVEDSRPICQKLIQKGAVVVQGHIFCPASVNSPYIRVSYSYASEEDLAKAFSWLADILKEQSKQ